MSYVLEIISCILLISCFWWGYKSLSLYYVDSESVRHVEPLWRVHILVCMCAYMCVHVCTCTCVCVYVCARLCGGRWIRIWSYATGSFSASLCKALLLHVMWDVMSTGLRRDEEVKWGEQAQESPQAWAGAHGDRQNPVTVSVASDVDGGISAEAGLFPSYVNFHCWSRRLRSWWRGPRVWRAVFVGALCPSGDPGDKCYMYEPLCHFCPLCSTPESLMAVPNRIHPGNGILGNVVWPSVDLCI